MAFHSGQRAGGPSLRDMVFSTDTKTAVHSTLKTPVLSEPQLKWNPASFSSQQVSDCDDWGDYLKCPNITSKSLCRTP